MVSVCVDDSMEHPFRSKLANEREGGRGRLSWLPIARRLRNQKRKSPNYCLESR